MVHAALVHDDVEVLRLKRHARHVRAAVADALVQPTLARALGHGVDNRLAVVDADESCVAGARRRLAKGRVAAAGIQNLRVLVDCPRVEVGHDVVGRGRLHGGVGASRELHGGAAWVMAQRFLRARLP